MLENLKQKTQKAKQQTGYKIYPAAGSSESVEIIEATTVAEAMEKSKLKSPSKIEKIGINHQNIFLESELQDISSNSINGTDNADISNNDISHEMNHKKASESHEEPNSSDNNNVEITV